MKITDSVDAEYRHIDKTVTPGAPLELPAATLKWYDIAEPDKPIPIETTALARDYLTRNPPDVRGLGFVLLHRCGEEFYFLIVCTWRYANEIWETVFYKEDDAVPDFEPFPRPGPHVGTYCVWEMVPVWHEQGAWRRFLTSGRDPAAALQWQSDVYAGPA